MKKENLEKMTGRELIAVADSFNIKVATNKERTGLKESKAKVIEKIMAALPKEEKKVRKQKRENKHTLEKAREVLNSIDGVKTNDFGKGSSVFVNGKKIMEIRRRLETIRIYVKNETLVNAGISDNLFVKREDNPTGTSKLDTSVYVAFENIADVIQAICK